jgi:hypothetical protein
MSAALLYSILNETSVLSNDDAYIGQHSFSVSRGLLTALLKSTYVRYTPISDAILHDRTEINVIFNV